MRMRLAALDGCSGWALACFRPLEDKGLLTVLAALLCSCGHGRFLLIVLVRGGRQVRSFAPASVVFGGMVSCGCNPSALRPISARLGLPQRLRIELAEVFRTGLLQTVQLRFVPGELLLCQFSGLGPVLVLDT